MAYCKIHNYAYEVVEASRATAARRSVVREIALLMNLLAPGAKAGGEEGAEGPGP